MSALFEENGPRHRFLADMMDCGEHYERSLVSGRADPMAREGAWRTQPDKAAGPAASLPVSPPGREPA